MATKFRSSGRETDLPSVTHESAIAPTVDAAFHRWLDYKRSALEAPRSLHNYRNRYLRDVKPRYGNLPLKAFDKAAFRTCLTNIQDRGALVEADHFIVIMRAFLSWCIREDYIEDHGALSFAKSSRHHKPGPRALSLQELALCWRAAARLPHRQRDAIRTLVLTGLRKNEVFHAHASEYEDGIWTLSGERMKARREHKIILPELGRAIFDRLCQQFRQNLFSDRVYPTMFVRLKPRLTAEIERLGGLSMPDWSFGSICKGVRTALTSDEMADLGYTISEDLAEIVLAHSLGTLNRRYNHSHYTQQIGYALSAWEHLLRNEIERQETQAPSAHVSETANPSLHYFKPTY